MATLPDWRLSQQPSTTVGLDPSRDIAVCLQPGGWWGRELRSGIQLVAAGNAVKSSGRLGMSLETTTNAADEWEAAGSFPAISTSDFTIEVLLTMTSGTSLSHVFGLGSSGLPDTGGTVGARRSILAFGGAAPCNIYFWGASRDLDSGVPFRADGLPEHVFVTASAGTMRFYRDGRQIASGATPTLVASAATQTLTVGSRHSAGGNGAVKVFKATIRNRALTAAEIAALTVNPWSDFLPLQSHIHFNTAAGGAADRPILIGGRLVNRGLTLGGLVS